MTRTSWRRGWEWNWVWWWDDAEHWVRLRVRLWPFAIFRSWSVRPRGWRRVEVAWPEPRRVVWVRTDE